MVERDSTETVDTLKEGGTVVSKIGGIFCDANGEVTIEGREGKKSKSGFRVICVLNNVAHRSVGSIVVGGNTS